MTEKYNHREKLIAGIRQRIENENRGMRLVWLWSYLFEAFDLPC